METAPAPIPAAVVLGLSLRSIVESEGGTLTVCHRSFSVDTPLADILDGSAVAETVTLTSDGRQALTSEWHTGAENEWVFVERWTAAGRVSHGWVDSATRKLLQTG